MPVNKKDNKKNAPKAERDSALVPKKESAGQTKPIKKAPAKVAKGPINALSTVGKKKTPKH